MRSDINRLRVAFLCTFGLLLAPCAQAAAGKGARRPHNPQPTTQNPQPTHPASLIPHPSSPVLLRRVQFRDADLQEVLLLLAAQAGVNVAILPDVTGKVTVSLTDVTLDDALNTLLPPMGFSFRKLDGQSQIGLPPLRLGRAAPPYLVHRTPPMAPPPPLTVKVENGRLTLHATSVELRAVLAGIAQAAGINLVPDATVTGSVTLSVEDADLHDLLKELALRTGTEMVTFGQVQEKVTARVKQLSFEDTLTTLLRGTKYAFAKQGGVYLIADVSPNSVSARAVSGTGVIPLRYLSSADFAAVVSALLPNTNYKVLKELNAVAVTGPPDLIARAKEEIGKLDQPGQQVMLEAVVLEMSTSASKTLGLTTLFSTTRFRASVPGGDLTFSNTAPFTREFHATLQSLISQGEARVLASPKVATLSGKQANIDISRVLYFRTAGVNSGGGQNGLGFPVFTVQQVQAGVVLRLTPTVGAEGDISLELQPEASSISGVSAEGLPEVSRRTVNTTLRVKDGETILIGGLRQREASKNVNQVPLLSAVPLLGRLFRTDSRVERESELLILVTPTLLKG